MRHLLKSKRGMTLIEVLAVTVIISIVASLIFNIIQSSVTQQAQQTKEANNLNDITYALKVVTKDIRRSVEAEANTSELTLTFLNGDTTTYFLLDEQLQKKSGGKVEIITDGIGCAEFSGTDVISIKLSNTSVCPEVPSTEIQLRKGRD